MSRAPVLSPVEAISLLIIPMVFCNILIFYMMFELILNGIAEITRFADRGFYDDWWNSTTWDEVRVSFPLPECSQPG